MWEYLVILAYIILYLDISVDIYFVYTEPSGQYHLHGASLGCDMRERGRLGDYFCLL